MSLSLAEHEVRMAAALALAEQAAAIGEVPVGATVVDSVGQILGQGFNRRETMQCRARITCAAR